MKADGLFIIAALVFIFIAWIATGGPTRPISQAGPFITPVTRTGEESQGYRSIIPANPIDISSYPRQVGGASSTISAGGPDRFTRTPGSAGSSVYLERSSIGAAATDPDLEYVSITNGGSAPVSLGSWRVASRDTGASAFLPPGVTLPPGGKAVIVSGRASYQSPLYQSLCAYGAAQCVWLNRSAELYAGANETISLMDANGAPADSFSY